MPMASYSGFDDITIALIIRIQICVHMYKFANGRFYREHKIWHASRSARLKNFGRLKNATFFFFLTYHKILL